MQITKQLHNICGKYFLKLVNRNALFATTPYIRILLVVFERCVSYLSFWYTFQENDLGDMRPKYIKAKEKTAHVTQRLETKKYEKYLLTDEQDNVCNPSQWKLHWSQRKIPLNPGGISACGTLDQRSSH